MYHNTANGGPNHDHRDLQTKFREDRYSDSRDMLTDGQTHTQTNRQTDRNTPLPTRAE